MSLQESSLTVGDVTFRVFSKLMVQIKVETSASRNRFVNISLVEPSVSKMTQPSVNDVRAFFNKMWLGETQLPPTPTTGHFPHGTIAFLKFFLSFSRTPWEKIYPGVRCIKSLVSICSRWCRNSRGSEA